jgi:hypothetical protein
MADSRGAIALPSVVAAAPLTAQAALGRRGGPAARLRSLSTNPMAHRRSETQAILQGNESTSEATW